MNRLCSIYFNANGSWTCPAGVTKVMLLGHAGGNGGGGGCTSVSSRPVGGAGTAPYLMEITVVPNTTYTITIGVGGIGATGVATTTAVAPVTGTSTSFGSLGVFTAQDGTSSSTSKLGYTLGGAANRTAGSYSPYVFTPSSSNGVTNTQLGGMAGGPGYFGSVAGSGGNGNAAGVGANGTNATGYGAGGGAGGNGTSGGGNGGNGGNGQLWVIWVE